MDEVTEGTKAKGAGKKAGGVKTGAKAGGKAAGGKAGGAKAGAAARAKKAGGATSNAKVEGQIGRMLVRAIWAQEWSLANPDGKGEQRKAAWKDAREAAMEKSLKPYRRALGSLARSGVTMTISEAAAKEADSEDDGGED